MIQIVDKRECSGCTACEHICPQHCIAMVADEEAFLYPKVDESRCIDCGLCDKVCPVLSPIAQQKPLAAYAVRHGDAETLSNSTSGGMFMLLAKFVLAQQGIVFAAKYNADWSVSHAAAMDEAQLELVRGTKYVQSELNTTFVEIKQHLKAGKWVLFVGTHCQVAGLKNYIRRPYDTLICVDIFCYGVPSPFVWQHYLAELTQRLSVNGDKATIKEIKFRDKQIGWRYNGVKISGTLQPSGKSFTLAEKTGDNLYMKAFLSGLANRPICGECPFKDHKSGSDLSIGDFWGIQRIHPELDDEKGVSAVFVHTDKGQEVLKQLNPLQLIEVQPADIYAGNPYFLVPSPTKPARQEFFDALHATNDFSKVVEQFTKKNMLQRVKHRIAKLIHWT